MDDLDNAALWGLIWLGLAASLFTGEMLAVGTFFLAPFAAGALIAAVVSFVGAPPPLSLFVFLMASVGSFFLLKPLAKKYEIDTPSPIGVGANRLLGVTGQVLNQIPMGVAGHGLVKVSGEKWNAEGRDGMGIEVGTEIRVVEVRGTRVIVEPAAEPTI